MKKTPSMIRVIDTETGIEYESLKQASKALFVAPSTLGRIKRGLSDTYKGRLKFVEIGPQKTARRVKCVETGVVYESFHDAGRKTGIVWQEIRKVALGEGGRKSTKGLHWELV